MEVYVYWHGNKSIDPTDLDDIVRRAARREDTGAGTNLRTGERDMSFEVGSLASAKSLAKRVGAVLRKIGVKHSVEAYDDRSDERIVHRLVRNSHRLPALPALSFRVRRPRRTSKAQRERAKAIKQKRTRSTLRLISARTGAVLASATSRAYMERRIEAARRRGTAVTLLAPSGRVLKRTVGGRRTSRARSSRRRHMRR